MFAKTQSKKIVCSQEATTRIPHHTQFKSNVSHLKSSFGQRKSYAMDRIDYLVNSHTILTCLLLQLFTNSASTRLDIFTHLNLVMPMKRKFPTRILAYHLYRAQTSFHSQSHQGQWYIDEHSSRETTHKTIDALSLKTIIRLSMKEIY